MADGQTQEVPEASVESRLEAFFSPQAEAPAEEKPELEAQEEQTTEEVPEESTEEEVEASAEADLAEYVDDNGQTYKVPKPVQEATMRWKDYSQKTAQVAQIAKAAEDRLQYAEAREQALGAVMSEVAELKALESQRKQFDQIDWGALYNADLGQAVKLRDQREMLDREIAQKTQAVQGKAGQVQQMLHQHHSKQWELAVTGAKQALGQYSQSDDVAAAQWAQSRNITEVELKGRFADARVLEAIHKAAKWDALQAGKPAAVAKAQAAPTVKPGATKGIGAQAAQKYRDARQKLSKSGDIRDAARLLMLKG
jgi:hypothetical protein